MKACDEHVTYKIVHMSCSLDLTTNSETTNLNFHNFLDQSEQVLQVLLLFFHPKQSFFYKTHKKSGFISLELVVGSGEQDFHFNIPYEKFIEISLIEIDIMHTT